MNYSFNKKFSSYKLSEIRHLLGNKAFFLCCILLFLSCTRKGQKYQILIQGRTMGTVYNINIVSPNRITKINSKKIKTKIDSVLKNVNKQMSTWDETSEISRFNHYMETKPFKISSDFYFVLLRSREISELSNGAFDITTKPLVSAWGFKKKSKPKSELSQEKIDSLLNFVSYHKLELLENNYIRKKHPNVTIDLGGIAKGFGVEKVSDLLDLYVFKNYFIEIGGECIAKGLNKFDQIWRIGINMPTPKLDQDDLFEAILSISDKAIATSGDYRNFYWLNKKFVSHRMNPKTGYPVYNQLASVTVIADDCTLADGLATAFLVIGTKMSLETVKRMKDVDIYLIERKNDSTFREYFSDGFKEKYKITKAENNF